MITSLMVMIFSKPKEGLQWKYNVAISKVAFSHYVLFSFFFFAVGSSIGAPKVSVGTPMVSSKTNKSLQK